MVEALVDTGHLFSLLFNVLPKTSMQNHQTIIKRLIAKEDAMGTNVNEDSGTISRDHT